MKLHTWLHVMACLVITYLASIALSWPAGCAIAMLAGLLKELFDKFCLRPFSIDDLFADAGGILLGSGLYILVAFVMGVK